MDPTTSSCYAILPSGVDLHCLQKNDIGVCIRCGCGYVLLEDKNTCAPVPYNLIGCEVVSPAWICKRPKEEYVMRTETTGVVIRYSNGSHCEIESTCKANKTKCEIYLCEQGGDLWSWDDVSK